MTLTPSEALTTNPVLPTQNTAVQTQIVPQPSSTQTTASQTSNLTIDFTDAQPATAPTPAAIPQTSTALFAVAPPNPSGNSVDSRLVRSATTPGTETAATPAAPSPATLTIAQQNAAASPAQAVPESTAPITNSVVSGNSVLPHPAAVPTVPNAVPPVTVNTPAQSVPAQSVAAAVTPAEPGSDHLKPAPTAASTSDQLARLRTVGTSEPAAAKPTVTASITADAASADVPANLPQTLKIASPVPGSSFAPAVSSSAAQEAKPSISDSIVPVTLPTTKLDKATAALPTSPVVSNSPTEPAQEIPAFDTPLAADASAPAFAFSADTVSVLAPSAISDHPQTGATTAAGTTENIVSEAVVRQTTGGNANTDSQGQNHSSQSRQPAEIATEKAGTVRPELLNGANGTAANGTNDAAAAVSTTNAPIDRTKLLNQVTQHLETLRLADGRGEVSFNLTPDHLGALQISIKAHADGVTARVVAEHAGVRQVLEAASGHLRDALENRGLKLHSLDVTTGQGNLLNGRNTGNAPQQQQRDALQDRTAFGQNNSRIPRNSTATMSEVPVTPASAIARTSDLRLDYRA